MLPPPSDHPEPAAFYLAACLLSDHASDDGASFDEAAGGDGPERGDDDRSTDVDDILWWSPSRDASDW